MAYKDVAANATCVLSRTPPLDLLALKDRAQGRSRRGAFRKVVREKVLETWRKRLEDGRELYGGEIVRALGSRLPEWVGRKHGALSFRLTQILMGYDVIGSYLARIGKGETTECWFCGALEDDVGHTLSGYPRWFDDRQRLV